MSKKRQLTEAEKRHVYDVQMALEQNRYPDHKIQITVDDESDDNGDPQWTVIKQKESIVPPSK